MSRKATGPGIEQWVRAASALSTKPERLLKAAPAAALLAGVARLAVDNTIAPLAPAPVSRGNRLEYCPALQVRIVDFGAPPPEDTRDADKGLGGAGE